MDSAHNLPLSRRLYFPGPIIVVEDDRPRKRVGENEVTKGVKTAVLLGLFQAIQDELPLIIQPAVDDGNPLIVQQAVDDGVPFTIIQLDEDE